MTEARYERVDLDRLADYLGGALDGTPDADAVAELIQTDPAWSAAYHALVSADAAVRADLRVLATAIEPLPADLAARLEAGLGVASQPVPRGPRLTVVRDSSGSTSRSYRRPRSRRWAVALAAAAAVVACGFGTVAVLPHVLPSRDRTAAMRDNGGPKAASEGGAQDRSGLNQPPAADAAPRLVASGADYTPDTLRVLAGRTAAGNPASSPGAAVAPGAPDVADAVPGELRRLADPAARQMCLSAILREYGGTVTLVDYARFEGRPALLVLLVGASGRAGPWVVVAGPDCGVGGAIADERYNGPAQ